VNFQAFSFWNFAKANVVMLAAGLVFNPLNVFAITNKVHAIYNVGEAGDNANVVPILMMAGILLTVLVTSYRVNTKSARCKRCGGIKHSLECLCANLAGN